MHRRWAPATFALAKRRLLTVVVSFGTPSLTPLSTNGTCQLEKTESFAAFSAKCGSQRRYGVRYGGASGELRKPEDMRNVGLAGALSRPVMLSTKLAEEFETEVVAPQGD